MPVAHRYLADNRFQNAAIPAAIAASAMNRYFLQQVARIFSSAVAAQRGCEIEALVRLSRHNFIRPFYRRLRPLFRL